MIQMNTNPQVALCSGPYNINGTITVIGFTKTLIDEKHPLIHQYKTCYPQSYARYSFSNNVLIEIKIHTVNGWFYEQQQPYCLELDLDEHTSQYIPYLQKNL